MKKNFFARNYIILLIYTLGLLHWLFFFFFVDYYSYNKIDPIKDTKFIDTNIISQGGLHHISLLKSSFYKGERVFIKQILNEKKLRISEMFQFKKFISNDWVKEHRYQNIIATSLREFKMPYVVDNLSHNFGFSGDLFFATPHYTLSPQIILLYFFDSEWFTFINLIFLYSIGFIGCLLIKNYFKLSTIPFLFLYLVFNFNGYHIEKYTAYGASMIGYYFFPYIFYFLLRFSEQTNNQNNYYWSIFIGLFLTLVLMQGSLHYYIAILTFLLFWSIVNYKLWKASFLIYLTSFSTGIYRLLPAFVIHRIEPNSHSLRWPGGYAYIDQFITSLVSVKEQLDIPVLTWWEYSLYISFLGLFILIYFSLWANLIEVPWRKFKAWKYFVIPTLLITIISFYKLKYFIVPDFIPLLNAQSFTSRYMIIPLIFLTIVASINFQGFIEHYKSIKRIKFTIIGIISVLALFLFNHSRIWRFHKLENEFEWANGLLSDISTSNLRAADLTISNSNLEVHSLYIVSIWTGLVVSLISFFIFIKLLLKLYNNKLLS
jgi:hypothetical protein